MTENPYKEVRMESKKTIGELMEEMRLKAGAKEDPLRPHKPLLEALCVSDEKIPEYPV